MPNPGIGLILSLFLLGIGGTFSFTPAFIGALSETPMMKRGRASGILNMVRSVGMSLGIAIFGAILINLGSFVFSQDLKKNSSTQEYTAANFQGILSHQPKAIENFKELSSVDQKYVLQSAQSSSIIAHRILIIAAFVCFTILFFLLIQYLPAKIISEEEEIVI